MKKQKHGFWVFIFSLIPGAGEMYMGFKKQGISIMLLFWGSIALASITGLGWLAMFLPVIWFYSFFNVHNLKSLSEEEFYSVEDNYILHMDQFSGDMGKFLQKHQSAAAWVLILFGICILWSRFTSLLYFIVPNNMADYVYNICNSLPQIVIAAGIIAAGIYLLTQQKKKLEEEKNKDEHYWEPYRPYQQITSLDDNSATAEKNGVSLIAVIMGAEDSKARFKDAVTLLNYGFGKCQMYTDENMPSLDPISVTGGIQESISLEYEKKFTYLDTTGANLNAVTSRLQIPDKVNAPVKKGDTVGQRIYYLDEKEIGSVNLLAEETVKKAGFFDYLRKALYWIAL